MEKLLEILRSIKDDVDYEKEEQLIDTYILDSFDIVTIVGEIEKEYGISLKASDIVPENFNSVKTMMAMIEKYR